MGDGGLRLGTLIVYCRGSAGEHRRGSGVDVLFGG